MRAGTSIDYTCYFEDGERVYPCRCGETHRGDYAAEIWNHHNCFHEDALLSIGEAGSKIQAICTLCGKSFIIETELAGSKADEV